jgi:protein-tyrosine-phosphatase
MTVLFVCTGNICRSPMAEAIARAVCGDRVTFTSAGLYALDGAPATGHAVSAAAEIGADASAHAARPVTAEIVDAADAVYVMTGEHRADLLRRVPGVETKVHLLDPDGGDVADPYGGTPGDYRVARDRIAAAIDARCGEWA